MWQQSHQLLRRCVDGKFAYKRTERNRETNATFQETLYHWVHQKIQRNKLFLTRRAFLSHIHACAVIICVMLCLRRVETESRFVAYAVHIASMILRTARFSCVIYALGELPRLQLPPARHFGPQLSDSEKPLGPHMVSLKNLMFWLKGDWREFLQL